jgi:hypothetical protein
MKDIESTIEPCHVQTKPIWVKDKGATALFGFSRSWLYSAAKDGRIKSVSLQEEGRSRGTRLFSVESIENYNQSFAK